MGIEGDSKKNTAQMKFERIMNDELEQICNKICIMMNGKVMEFSNIEDIIGDEPIKKSKLTEYYLHKYQGNVFLS